MSEQARPVIRRGSLFEGMVRAGELTYEERQRVGLIKFGRNSLRIAYHNTFLTPEQVAELASIRNKEIEGGDDE